jgi:hypothetical protein
MTTENFSQVCQKMQPLLADILCDFNEVLQGYGLAGITVVEFKVGAINDPAVVADPRELANSRGFCCWRDNSLCTSGPCPPPVGSQPC